MTLLLLLVLPPLAVALILDWLRWISLRSSAISGAIPRRLLQRRNPLWSSEKRCRRVLGLNELGINDAVTKHSSIESQSDRRMS
jgi:hypothetical protein